MGIERFFNSIKSKYTNENLITDTQFPYKKVNSEYLFFDFNSIIHNISMEILNELNNTDNLEISKYTNDYINNLIIEATLFDLLFIIKNNFNYNNLKLIHIAIDGTPSKAKIIEQRKRRFLGKLETTLKSSIIKNKNKISWSKNNISPGTEFMNKLIKKLKSKEFKSKIKDLMKDNKKFRDFIVSGTKEFGEGEKKIIDYIVENKISNSITIFSPDADVILLSLILLKYSKKITILRRDQQLSEKIYTKSINEFVYNIIDIDLLGKILYSYISKDKNIKIDNVINDIVLLFSFFGDDFIPKLESYSVDKDIDFILNKYSKILTQTNQYFIKDGKINMLFLKKLLNELSLNEDITLQRNYVMNNYHNYRKLKKQVEEYLDKSIDHKEFITFIKTYNFYRLLETLKLDKSYDIDYLKKNLENIYSFKLNPINYPNFNEIDEIINSSVQFNTLLKKSSDNKVNVLNHIINKNTIPMFNNFYKKSSKFRTAYKTYYLALQPSNHNIEKNYYHQNNIKNLSKEEVEYYKLNKMLDEYYFKLNKQDIVKLGNTKEFEQSKEKFYKTYFKKDKNTIIKEYLEGLYWINEYYFNDRLCATWFYKNYKSPLIQDISKFLNKNDYNFDYMEKKYNFNNIPTNFFTNLEQLIYITPFNVNDLENDTTFSLISYLDENKIKKIKQFLLKENIRIIYFNINKIAKDILNNNNKDLYCTNAHYFNKCHLKQEETLYTYNDEVFIQEFRKLIGYEQQKITFDQSLIDNGLIYKLIKNKNNKYLLSLF